MAQKWKCFLFITERSGLQSVLAVCKKQISPKGLTTITWLPDPKATIIFGQTTPNPQNVINGVDPYQTKHDLGSVAKTNSVADKNLHSMAIGTRDPLLTYDNFGNSVSNVYDPNTNTAATGSNLVSNSANDVSVGDTPMSGSVVVTNLSSSPVADRNTNMAAGSLTDTASSAGSVDALGNTVGDTGAVAGSSSPPGTEYFINVGVRDGGRGGGGVASSSSGTDPHGTGGALGGAISDPSVTDPSGNTVIGEAGGVAGSSHVDPPGNSAALVGGSISGTDSLGNTAVADVGGTGVTGGGAGGVTGGVGAGEGVLSSSSQDPFRNTAVVGEGTVSGSPGTDYFSNTGTGGHVGGQDTAGSPGTDPYGNTGVVGGGGVSETSFGNIGQASEGVSGTASTDNFGNPTGVLGGSYDASGSSIRDPFGNSGLVGEATDGGQVVSGPSGTFVDATGNTATDTGPAIYDPSGTHPFSNTVGERGGGSGGVTVYDPSGLQPTSNTGSVAEATAGPSVTHPFSNIVGGKTEGGGVGGGSIYDPSGTQPSGNTGTHPYSNAVGAVGAGGGGGGGVDRVGTSQAWSSGTGSVASTADGGAGGPVSSSSGTATVSQRTGSQAVDNFNYFKKLFAGQSDSWIRKLSDSMGQLSQSQIQTILTKLKSAIAQTSATRRPTPVATTSQSQFRPTNRGWQFPSTTVRPVTVNSATVLSVTVNSATVLSVTVNSATVLSVTVNSTTGI
ncbi:uncharacterized PE-PGRS family protein PE_PGRS54-like [Gigantopelta aegis]|uniref:uncharacterized PE-PGRS family protein PE_PGRS54-like n=1 Tax=Gigantopelta aegis TaxID=1735272 RepID=UPI001B88B916|nr:uncharacterized PE-PGRS family protein PE_PGRS54-like [Gigantopelta aegis]